jgi:glycosyltransferase involved in cell wall biosynthesis
LGGPTYNAAYLSKYLAPEFETLLLAGQKDEHEASSEFILKELGLEVRYIQNMQRGLNPFKDWAAFWEIRRIIQKFRPDIVHTHAAKAGALGRLAAWSLGVPLIIHTFHGHVFHSYFSAWKSKLAVWAERFLAKISTRIIAISPLQQVDLCEHFKIVGPEKCSVVANGLNLDPFYQDREKKRQAFRAEFKIEDDCVAIGIIGRLAPIKNHRLFLEGLKLTLDHCPLQVRAFIIGDGEKRVEIENLATELGLGFVTEKSLHKPAVLTFTSWRKDIDVVNAGLDIVVLTSLNEGTPLSLIEAQAAGKAILSTKVGGVADVVIENETALLCAQNPNDFSLKLRQLLQDAELRAKLGNNGSTLAAQRFSYQRLVQDMGALYRHLLSASDA